MDGFLRSVWQVVPDPEDIEYISSPVHQVRLFASRQRFVGDCDDAATMAACLLAALDWPCTLVALRNPGKADFEHVWCRAPLLEYGPWDYDIDPIVPADMLPLAGYEELLEVPVL